MKKYYCKEKGCSNKICKYTVLYGKGNCKSCAMKNRIKENGHPAYKDGYTMKQHYCKDCGTKIWYTSIRCHPCATKKQIKDLGNLFGGKYHSEETKEKCRLNHLGKKHTKAIKNKISLSKGGTGIPYEHNVYPAEYFKIRPKILKRDDYTCQLCDKKFTKFSIGYDVHHIDYNKDNNKESNLICLGHRCNLKVNHNKDYYYAYFMYIIELKL